MAATLVPEIMIPRVAQRFKVLSEPVRLELLNALARQGEMSVQALVDATGHRQANVSKHLNMMAREGLLRRRKEGLYVYYSIGDPSIEGLCFLVSTRLKQEVQQEHRTIGGGYIEELAA